MAEARTTARGLAICWVADSALATDGPGRHAVGLAGALRPALRRLELALPDDHPRLAVDSLAVDRVAYVLPSRHLYYARTALFLPRVLAAALRLVPLVRRSDLVHAVKDYPFSLVAAIAARLAGRPLVLTVHGTFGLLPFGSRRHRRKLAWVYRRAACVLCVSRYTRDRLLPHVPAAKLRLIPSGVDRRLLAAAAARQEGRPSETAPFLLSVGLVRERKGLDVSIAAFLALAPEFPGLSYEIAGALRDEPYVRQLRALIDGDANGARVHLLGEVDEQELARLYAECALFVLTPKEDVQGRFEGLGLVYLEAAAFGKAVVGTLGCGAEDAVEDGVTGLLVPPDDPRATAEAIRRLLSDRGLRARLGAAGASWTTHRTWDRSASELLAAYRDAVAVTPGIARG